MVKKFRLSDLVAPQTVPEFLHYAYSRSWNHYRGNKDRFEDLADWGTLNNLLATQSFEAPRFRVARRGEILPIETYTEQIGGSASCRKIVVDRLLSELRDGASLTFSRIDEAHEPIRELAAMLEMELRVRVFVNLFASWMPVPGFDPHWDESDVFAIQLEGRKRWRIFEPTRQWPLSKDVVENLKSETSPVAELEMTAGDVLYLPHGWWHSVCAVDEPSLHLTIGIIPDSGIDFILWLMEQAQSHELFRRRLPRLLGERQQKEYMTSVRAAWNELIAPENILDQFFTYIDGTSRSRPLFAMPDILDFNSVLDRKGARIALLAPRATITQVDAGFVLTALGRRWSFPLTTKPLIDAILSQDYLVVGQAIKLNVGVGEERSAQVIFTLLRAGVVALQ